MARALEPLLATLVEIASCIQERRPEAALAELLVRAQGLCEQAAVERLSGEVGARLLADVKPALQTWQQVWVRLGCDPEFRMAVAREAHLWAKRLADLAGLPEPTTKERPGDG